MISWSDESESAICEVVVYEVRTVITKPLVVMFFFWRISALSRLPALGIRGESGTPSRMYGDAYV